MTGFYERDAIFFFARGAKKFEIKLSLILFFKNKSIYYFFAHWYLIRTNSNTRGLNLEYYINQNNKFKEEGKAPRNFRIKEVRYPHEDWTGPHEIFVRLIRKQKNYNF